MAQNIESLSVESLMELRNDIDALLKTRIKSQRKELEAQLARLEDVDTAKKRGVKLGTKIEPKYRGPNGETWTGRGGKPRWLKPLLKKGVKVEDFLIDKKRRKAA